MTGSKDFTPDEVEQLRIINNMPVNDELLKLMKGSYAPSTVERYLLPIDTKL